MYAARFTFADGFVTTVEVAEHQTVLEAAMAADAPVRYDCASGECGACVAHLAEGQAACLRDGPTPLSEAEMAAGLRATCRTRLASDAVFHLPYALEPRPSDPGRHNAEVLGVARLSDTVFRLRLSRPEGFAFQAGQYVRLRPPGRTEARAYSIASHPADESGLEFLIRHVPGGLASEWVAGEAKAGDRVKLQGPLGSFARDDRASRQVFVVGGTGLAPALSMLRQLAPGAGEALVCFGVTTPGDAFHQDELRALSAAHGAMEVRFAVAQGQPRHGEQAGTAVSLLSPDDVTPATAFHLCGPPPMVEAARAALVNWGAPLAAIRAERYLPTR